MDRKSPVAKRIRQYHFHGVLLDVIAEVEQVPLWEVQTICRYPILKTEFAAPLEREESFVSPNAHRHPR